MPPLIMLFAAGIGLYTGYKWIAREVDKATTAADKANETLRRRAEATRAVVSKDLGELVWDEKAGLYRPKGE